MQKLVAINQTQMNDWIEPRLLGDNSETLWCALGTEPKNANTLEILCITSRRLLVVSEHPALSGRTVGSYSLLLRVNQRLLGSLT